MMRSRLLTLGLAAGMILATLPANAVQNSRTATANANARVITAISITKLVDLQFKDIVPGAAAGTVVMSPAGVRTSTGGTTLGSGAGSSAASFRVSGQANANFTVVLPNLVNVTNGVQTMRVNAFTRTPSGTVNLGAPGTQTLSVGATCSVAANQAGGAYTANFNVTVSYN